MIFSSLLPKISQICCYSSNRVFLGKTIRNYSLFKSTLFSQSFKLNSDSLWLKSVRKAVTHVNQETTNELSSYSQRLVGIWLLSCAGLTFATVIIGGVTRLTNSGLSMVDWHPFKEFPPLSASQWTQEFEKYKLFPEFKIRNKNITLEEFKLIWYMEYIHRTLGRTIGALYFIPATIFWYKNWFTKSMRKRAIIFGALLAFQGLLGWYMVKSGLQEKEQYTRDPKVSHYRLAAHLGTVFVFYSLLLWSGLSHVLPPLQTKCTKQMRLFRRYAHSVKGLLFLTALSGALVAGLDAGLIYNSFPMMADKWIPDEILSITPLWKNFTENTATVQFDHRILGELVFACVTALWLYSRRLPLNSRTRLAVNFLMLTTLVQVSLGIANLLFYVPTPLAASHQAGALSALSVAVWLTHELKLLKNVPK